MKSLLRIIRRYSLTAGLIIVIILASNAMAFLYVGYYVADDTGAQDYGRGTLDEITEEVVETQGAICVSEEGIKRFEESDFVWGMALDEKGNVVWDYKLPEEIPRQYTLQEVSAFSRWYLEDYPVRVWSKGKLLFVFGCNPETIARYDMIMATSFFKNLPVLLKIMIVVNFLVILLFVVVFGYRFYRSMRPVAQGIELLTYQEPVDLEEKGLAGELAGKLNAVSKILSDQSREIAKRDQARTEWIAGVSHDIRTPLSLIMGHSDKLSRDGEIGEENRRRAESIKKQSIVIRDLIADLNLTSKLTYQTQPINISSVAPTFVLRECVAEFYNGDIGEEFKHNEIEQKFSIEIRIDEEAEQIRAEADERLIRRALRNLLGNSIRHNPEGCHIRISLYKSGKEICWLVEDTGSGIPEIIVENIDVEKSAVHIMGLRLTDKIARAHGGKLNFIKRENGNYDAELRIRLK